MRIQRLLIAGIAATSLGWVAPSAQTPGALAPGLTPSKPGIVITSTATIRRGTYRLASADLDAPVMTIRGRDITVDLTGAELVGSPDGADPDRFAGLAILIDGGERITVKGARIRGYKVGILARNVTGLTLVDNDASGNWKQRLYSRVEQESLVDWLSYHRNEKDEWLRYGAGIYLSAIAGGEVRGNRARQGQNGLLITGSRDLRIWNNDFSFLSGVGLGLYRTTGSAIMHNRIDWCVRGYSHGFYNRGQDSAGLLMYEQSSGNVVAYNSVTHGGDGLFLWAGQSTMDTGKGGSNDNLFYGNDFSHAPTNGIEATFSRNRFVANRIEENWHGVWGGYSYESLILRNTFAKNDEAIAIEHGQDNVIAGNTFTNDATAIHLWWNPTQDPNWGYPKLHDTDSRDYLLAGNVFTGVKTPSDITGTRNVQREDVVPDSIASIAAPPPMPDGIEAMIPAGSRRGRQYIIVDEWGPYDWQSPKLWPVGRSDETPLRLRVLGPEGHWKLEATRGATLSVTEGSIPGEVVVTPTKSITDTIDFTIRLRDDKGKPFEYERFFVPISWRVLFHEFTRNPKLPESPDQFGQLLGQPTEITARTLRLDYLTGQALAPGLPNNYVALSGEGEVDVPPGDHELLVISDEGVRIWVDDRLVIDNWTAHESAIDRAPIARGKHKLRVEYYELTGYAELRVEVVKRQR
ncbi:MAG TPA: NosD domain-containing protein [Vicinamibacterales bacterium]|nr:NosD domain-containing protein [Vicinamibacterales bacterium]